MLPIVLKADFIRRNDALSRGVNLFILNAMYQLMILASQICPFGITKNRLKIVNIEKSPKYLIFTSDE